ncbi:TetR family transcriptional regulator [Acinetobacter sp. ME22]|uniref:TetR/AcrR family transcriptional regulator n=1 Tax=Acinetobacter sp. ME22 TaxID=2904802 RepID=UPI001EDA41E8|nr:TetR family transcriptional regulator [Acinetobacter sp. ME22]MCG2574784.1 TetR family transcriptional regulator [Acinetobacter sp. ME22]
MAEGSAKDKILNAATFLFYKYGISNTGINSITEHAKVAKMSLYNNYNDKSELIADYINLIISDWLKRYEDKNRKSFTPIEKILAIFDTYIESNEFFCGELYRGCGLINASVEFDLNSKEIMYIKKHKDNIEGILEKNIKCIINDPIKSKKITRVISYLLEGSLIKSGLESDFEKIKEARYLVVSILVGDI